MTTTSRRQFLQTGAVTAASLPFLRAMPAHAQSGDVLVAVNGHRHQPPELSGGDQLL